MPVESAVYLNTLVPTDPVHTDGLAQADSHLRLIKSVLQATFPHIAGPVAATDVDLSNVAGLVSNGLMTVPAPSSGTVGAGIVLDGIGSDADITMQTAAGTLFVNSGTTNVATLTPGGQLNLLGPLNATVVEQSGSPLLPTGMIVMWYGSVATIPAGWHLCDGTSGTPDFRDAFVVGAGLNYAPGAFGGFGTQTATTSTSGSHSHSGATGAAGAFTPSVTLSNQGLHNHGTATQGHALTLAEIPNHDHGLGGQGVIVSTTGGLGGAGGTFITPITFQAQGGNQAHTHGISDDGSHTHTATAAAAPAHTHTIALDGSHAHTAAWDNRPPFFALCYIMKL